MVRKQEKLIVFYPFNERSSLKELLSVEPPPFHPGEVPFAQLNYIERYVRTIECKSLLIESEYIDRDYMEDYGVFYSRCLKPFGNACKRIHFFRLPRAKVQAALSTFIKAAGEEANKSEVDAWCEQNYLGFMVKKPLQGCPVGRTVLRVMDKKAKDGYIRDFSSCRKYGVHLFGLELSIRGLAFQQQDLGVSACATTALWSSLHKVQSREDIAHATPAQITRHATLFSLPFGRPMPSEGLTTNQMCVAIQALELSPSLIRIDSNNKKSFSLATIRSACKSGFAPVLILKPTNEKDSSHAVTVAGFKMKPPRPPSRADVLGGHLRDASKDLEALYLHDDRLGAYLKATFNPDGSGVVIDVERKLEKRTESWKVTHLLIPMYPKIRLSFADLQHIARQHLSKEVMTAYQIAALTAKPTRRPPGKLTVTSLDIWIEKGYEYFQTVSKDHQVTGLDHMLMMCNTVRLPKYVGVISLDSPHFGNLDVLVDTTSTVNNLHFVGLVDKSPQPKRRNVLRRLIAEACQCPVVVLHLPAA